MTDEEILEEYRQEFIARLKGMNQDQFPWFTAWEENGAFEIVSRQMLIEAFAQTRLDEQNGDRFLQDFHGHKSFNQAKKYLIGVMTDWRNEIAQTVRDIKAFKKPK